MEMKENPTNMSLALLLNKARTDTKLAASIIADLDKVIDEYKLVVDPNDKVYQELSLRLFHFRNTQVAGFVEEIVKEFNVGSLIKPAAETEIPFSGAAYLRV